LNFFKNIEIVKVDEYDLKLESGAVTLGFVANVLHEIDDLKKYLAEIRRVLNDQGQLIIIEWEKRQSDFGPPVDHRLEKQDLVKVLEAGGFIHIETLSLGIEFYAVSPKGRLTIRSWAISCLLLKSPIARTNFYRLFL
jgi:ubiquinone/menaquinone biosynthesis C-methylase UbiE